MSGSVDWFGDEVKLILKNATAEMIRAAAFAVEGQAKVNITTNGQVDTGFMRNSVYAAVAGGASSGGASSGTYTSYKEGRSVERRALPQMNPPEDGAIVAVGAEYGIYQEQERAFLYPALERVAQTMEGQIIAAGQKVTGK